MKHLRASAAGLFSVEPEAFGGVPKVAAQAHLNQTQLYSALSPTGNPTFNSLSAILKAMGMHLAVQPIQTPATHP
jgi:DNA-binding phage protein